MTAKRRRAEDVVVEILIAPVGEASSTGPEVSGSRNVDYTPKPTRSHGSPLLGLESLDIAICSHQAVDGGHHPWPRPRRAGQPRHRAGRRDCQRGQLPAEPRPIHREHGERRVFAARHSRLPGELVAKVSKYRGSTPGDLVRCANLWLREKRVLEKLDHVSLHTP